MNLNRLTSVFVPVCLGLLACAGCVEREEAITIARDGTIIIELEYEGTEEQLAAGDAMPSSESGWNVVRSTKKEDDKVKHILKSKRRFEPGEPLPSSFASPDDPDADLYLEFPTTLRMERRRDATYYYFRRVYAPRHWSYVRHWEDFCFDDHVKKLGEKPVEELTLGDRVQIAQAFVGFEAFKQLEFVAAAAEESGLNIRVEHWLIARRALMKVYKMEMEVFEKEGAYWGPIAEIIESCGQLPEPKQGECYDQEVELILDAAYDAYVQSLQHGAGLTGRQITAFTAAYARAERYYQITDQLGGHQFEIQVKMPGTIIAHNLLEIGEDEIEVYEDENASRVIFNFDGKLFRDQPYELIVVSRLDDGADTGKGSRSDDSGR